MEKTSPKISKKMLNILRIMIYLAKKSFQKSNKLIFDLRVKLATKKALNHYYSALICKSNDSNLSFISPRDYEFSCSNTPARSKRKTDLKYDVVVVKKVIEILNESSPLNLPGFGRNNSPNYGAVRQLRVTDSPFGVEDCCCDEEVDKDCEDFIERFYKELKNQRRESPLLKYRI